VHLVGFIIIILLTLLPIYYYFRHCQYRNDNNDVEIWTLSYTSMYAKSKSASRQDHRSSRRLIM